MYKSFRDMSVWQKAINLSEKVFRLTVSLPKSEDYGITSQIRRSANSVSANIAEGFGRNTNKDKRNFYIIARGSAFETQSHLLYGNKIKYFESKMIEELISEYNSLIFELNKIIKSLKVWNFSPLALALALALTLTLISTYIKMFSVHQN